MDIPSRAATDEHLFLTGRRLDIAFDVDLGELAEGRHVIARGIALGGPVQGHRSGGLALAESEFHYESVPGVTEEWADRNEWWWSLSVEDDVGTDYGGGGFGAFDANSGGVATAGTRQLGRPVPPNAGQLTIRFYPAPGWTPPEPWCRKIVIDLHEERLISRDG